MTDWVMFRVNGTPIPQGSKTIMQRGLKAWLVDSNANKLKPWRKKIADAARAQGVQFDMPVWVIATFFFNPPKRFDPKRPWLLFFPAKKPDTDKLMRALQDGLKDGGLVRDDALIVDPEPHKRYATDTNPEGVFVIVMPMEEEWA